MASTTGKNNCSRYVAIDMGAESARAMVGHFEGDQLRLEELHRWPSRNAAVQGTQYWDILFMFSEIQFALGEYAKTYGPELGGIGIDSWGVDYGILGETGQLLQNPVQYRDHRTDGLIAIVDKVMSREDIYGETGIAFLSLNTLYQLWAMQKTAPEVLNEGKTFLMMSDLLHYFLSGVAKAEYTNASTTQLVNVRTRQWSEKLFKAFGMPFHFMPEIVEPGTILGPLSEAVAKETGLSKDTRVITPCTHDTASAVLAIPAEGTNWAYISCGTWSLMGTELDEPIATKEALACNFTNEGGFDHTIRFLKNIMGLWVLQQTRAAWARRGEQYDYAELTERAREAKPFQTVLNIDENLFFNPDDMLDAIAQHCADTGQEIPDGVGATVRAIIEGLALCYAVTLRDLESVTARKFDTIHMVGGGIQNELLCQLASDAMGRPVVAGPTEGTAMGNIVTQAIATGRLTDRVAARKVIAASTPLKVYEPQNSGAWKELVDRFTM
jgi:rhamnulokinase